MLEPIPGVFWSNKVSGLLRLHSRPRGPFITSDRKETNKDGKQLGRTFRELLQPLLFGLEKDNGGSTDYCMWELLQGQKRGWPRLTLRQELSFHPIMTSNLAFPSDTARMND